MSDIPIYLRRIIEQLDDVQFSIQDKENVNQDPLPEKLSGISHIVLQNDTTRFDDLDGIVIPDIPLEGEVLYHNQSVDYDNSSQFLFDNAHKFNDPTNPLIVTLYFKLGFDDDERPLYDLILRANSLQQLGSFKFKIYIFKFVDHEKPNRFMMPKLDYLMKLNIIAFRFDTDMIPENTPTNDFDFYQDTIRCQPSIPICWLSSELEELYIGQKVSLEGQIQGLTFPKLSSLGIESYDIISCHNLSFLVNSHNHLIKTLTLRDDSSAIEIPDMPVLEKCTLIGNSDDYISRLYTALRWAKVLYCYGCQFHFLSDVLGDLDLAHSDIELFYSVDSRDPDSTRREAERLNSAYGIRTTEVPLLAQHITIHSPIRVRLDYDQDHSATRYRLRTLRNRPSYNYVDGNPGEFLHIFVINGMRTIL
ncbi:hypothetical protein DFJ63DRAFT_320195 [Scheffersomyces coipomensis]|uniref:uncharacterized protein n=1 Tax=Scheffersomyces coipomensis TaxID=1788519 RepID=UPI00315D9771